MKKSWPDKTVAYISQYANEHAFEGSLKDMAPVFGCEYIKIPDPIPFMKKSGMKGVPLAHLRPFDGILVTPGALIALELKHGYNRVEDHQREFLRKVREKTGMGFVLRYVELSDRFEFRIEDETGERLGTIDNLATVIKWFKIKAAMGINFPLGVFRCSYPGEEIGAQRGEGE